jgi:flagellar assembly protein FliH
MAAKIIRDSTHSNASPHRWATVQSGARLRSPHLSGAAALAAGGDPDPQARVAELERELAQRTEQAFQEGQASGAQQAAARMEPLMDRLAGTLEELLRLKPRLRREAEQDLVRLSLAIARRILRRELTVDPEAVSGIVKAALDRLDAREVTRIRIRPSERAALERRLAGAGLPESVEIAGDPSLEPGAVILETTRGRFDASVETQLEEIERGFADMSAAR